VIALMLSEMSRSPAAKASWMPSLARTSSPMRALSKVTRALERAASSLRDVSACSRRREPSKGKGMVTKGTKKAPSSRAIRATRGEAPEPVPPPRPAQRKTMLCPLIMARISSSDSLAAWPPRSGSPPVPSPFVKLEPS